MVDAILGLQGYFAIANPTTDSLTALGTVAAAIFAGVSALIAARAARDAARTITLSSEAIRSQAFFNIIAYERDIDLRDKMVAVGKIVGPQAQYQDGQVDILEVLNFFNFVAHTIRHKYVTAMHVLLLYSPRLKECREHLIDTGWLQSYRKYMNDGRFGLHFECLCSEDTIRKLSQGKGVVWTGDIYVPSMPT